jgi:putative mRNA 3-end processing factor
VSDPLIPTDRGLYCPSGGFYIDPWKPVERSIVTHAHGDHARLGMDRYLCADEGRIALQYRLGPDAKIDSVPYGEQVNLGGAKVSLHPAGHVIGSAQVRVEVEGHITVVSGDYKTEADRSCTPFELVKCHTFVTESTFGLPIYRWPNEGDAMRSVCEWWQSNQAQGKCSVLFGYALGKCQRVLAQLDPSIGPIVLHGAVENMTRAYRESGFNMPETHLVSELERGFDWSKAIVLAPPSAHGTTWMRRFGDLSTAFASGWMAIRGTRRRRSVDRGFVISDHVDWPSLINVISETEAEKIWVTHGYSSVVVRYLEEHGMEAQTLATAWEGEADEPQADEQSPEEQPS